MKKILIILAICTLSTGRNTLWAGDKTLDVVMSVQILDIELNPASTDYRNIQLTVRELKIIRSTIKNIGTGNQDYSLRIASTTGVWRPVSRIPLIDEYALTAIWHEWNTLFATDTIRSVLEMQPNDFVTPSFQTSSDKVFFNDFETHAKSGVQGTNVPVFEDRNLFILVVGPSASTSGGENATAHMEIQVSATP